MIPNQWYAILESDEVPSHHPVSVTRMGEKLVVWRDDTGAPIIQSDQCPHRGAALSGGVIKEGCLQCPFHGFEFDSSGRCTLIPANGKSAAIPKAFSLYTYPAREESGYIWMWWGKNRENYPPIPFFDDLTGDFSFSRFHAHWKTHYSRVIENQLDVFHLPFIHRTTIGRGNRTLSNGPVVKENPEGFDIWVYNQVDDGSMAVKPDAMPEPQRQPYLQFKYPNIWMNRISDDMRIIAVFVPVDAENTLLYIRNYQRILRIPVLRELYNWIMNIGSQVIAKQDQSTVETQRPARSDLKIGEKLIPQDRPIILYRSRRRAMIDAAENQENG